MTALAVAGIRKRFGGVEAVGGLGFELGQGQIAAIIGPNGAGKTTLFNILGGQLQPDHGSVRLGGTELVGLPTHRVRRAGVGRTFQIAQTLASFTVRENLQMAWIAHFGRMRSLWPRARDLYVAESDSLLAGLGMSAFAERACGTLAHGDLKRVELAMAMVGEPKLLLLDEPTAGMAPAERVEMMARVTALVRARQVTLLFVEHDMDAVFGHAERVLVLDRGRLIADGPPDAVRADPRVQAVYLGPRFAKAAGS